MPSVAFNTEAEWLALREGNVGGSEVASLFYRWRLPDGSEAVYHMFELPPEGAVMLGCLSPYKSGFRLYNEKAGILPPDFAENERIDAGTFLEPAIASWSQKKFGWKLRKTRRYMTHPEVDGWGASRDFELIGLSANYAPVEVKNVDYLVFRDQWSASDDEIEVPPIHINLQLQSQIGLDPKCTHGYILVNVGGNSLKRGRIERHEPTQQRIAEAITAFWAAVKAGVPPLAHADYDTVADLYREGVTSEQPVDLVGFEGVPVMLSRFVRYKAHQKFVEEQIDQLKGKIGVLLGTATKGALPGWSISWPAIHREEAMLPAKLQKALSYRGGMTVRQVKEKSK